MQEINQFFNKLNPMSKKITRCQECPFTDFSKGHFCTKLNGYYRALLDKIPDDCPLNVQEETKTIVVKYIIIEDV